MSQIAKSQVQARAIDMLQSLWQLKKEAKIDIFRGAPPEGLGKSDADIASLKEHLENNYFHDVGIEVSASALVAAARVSELCDIIWEHVPAAKKVPLISMQETEERTATMLEECWNLVLTKNEKLKERPPQGLGKTELDIAALKVPLENKYFHDVCIKVNVFELVAASTVSELCDKIWNDIPAVNRI